MALEQLPHPSQRSRCARSAGVIARSLSSASPPSRASSTCPNDAITVSPPARSRRAHARAGGVPSTGMPPRSRGEPRAAPPPRPGDSPCRTRGRRPCVPDRVGVRLPRPHRARGPAPVEVAHRPRSAARVDGVVNGRRHERRCVGARVAGSRSGASRARCRRPTISVSCAMSLCVRARATRGKGRQLAEECVVAGVELGSRLLGQGHRLHIESWPARTPSVARRRTLPPRAANRSCCPIRSCPP